MSLTQKAIWNLIHGGDSHGDGLMVETVDLVEGLTLVLSKWCEIEYSWAQLWISSLLTNLLGPYPLCKPRSLAFLSSLWTLKYNFNPLFSASIAPLMTVACNQDPWLKQNTAYKYCKGRTRQSLKKIIFEDTLQCLLKNISIDK